MSASQSQVSFRDFISSTLVDFTEHDSFYTGYIDGTDNFKSFSNALNATGYLFVITASNHRGQGAVYFHNKRKGANVHIPFFGSPYEHLRNTHYECFQGNLRSHESKKAALRQQSDHPEKEVKKRNKPSKKIGCPGLMHVSQISVYPEYKITRYNAHGSDEQTKVVKKLKTDIAASKLLDTTIPVTRPTSFHRYMIRISNEDVHNHPRSILSTSKKLSSSNKADQVDVDTLDSFSISNDIEEIDVKPYGTNSVAHSIDENIDVRPDVEPDIDLKKGVSELRQLLQQVFDQTFSVGDLTSVEVAKLNVLAAKRSLESGLQKSSECMNFSTKRNMNPKQRVTNARRQYLGSVGCIGGMKSATKAAGKAVVAVDRVISSYVEIDVNRQVTRFST